METLIFSVDVTSATQKIGQITADLNALKDANKALLKEVEAGNKDAQESYGANQVIIKQLAQEQRNLTAAVEGYSKTVKSSADTQKFQNNSIQQNRDLLKQLTAQYITMQNPTKQATAQIKQLSDTLKQQESAIGDTRRNVGNYKDALGQLPGALGNATQSSLRLFDTLKANPYIAIIGLVYQFINALKQNEKAAEAFEQVMAGIQSVVQTIADVTVEAVESLGFLKNAFSDPVGTIKELGRVIQDNLINRFKALGGFVEAIALVFDGQWKQAAKQASNAALQLTTGIEGLSDRIIDNAAASAAATKSLQEIEDAERELAKQTAITTTEIEKQKNLQTSGKTLQERQAAAKKVIELSKLVRDEEVKFANERVLALTKLAEANKGNEDIQKRLSQAVIQQQQILQEFYSSTRKAAKLSNDELEKDISLIKTLNLTLEDLKKKGGDALGDLGDDLGDIVRPEIEAVGAAIDNIPSGLDRAAENFEGLQQRLGDAIPQLQEGANVALTALDAISLASQTSIDNRIAQLNQQTEDQIANIERLGLEEQEKEKRILAVREKAAKKEEQLERQSARNQKAIQTIQAGIAGALAVIQSLANTTLPFPASLAAPIAIGALTAVQIAAINRQQFEQGGEVPIMADGGRVIPIRGKSHSRGGENVSVGGRTVANIEGGEGMFIMKKTAFQSINKYSNINKAFGGRSWTGGSTKHAADGGQLATFVAANDSSNQVNQQIEQSRLLAKAVSNTPAPVLSLTELDKAQGVMRKSVRVSELG